MPSHIYTRKGDTGETGLFSGERVQKISPRVEAYGTVDEFNSSLGVAKTFASPRLAGIIEDLQIRNFFIASELATTDAETPIKKVEESDTEFIEHLTDELDEEMRNLGAPSEHFIVPGGTKAAAFLHVSRTILRRAERQILRLSMEEIVNPALIKYINRLSDTIFILARYANIVDGDGDLCISRDGTFVQKKQEE
ncbi:MAG TPA: cob(I)yrinic acid a,c-diamide adenosyltransferase [Candidatus Lokiarchaeia archaeon]|nr:cob(I)yrinic acid a,c-diamide adenosyltransferase [Candidatus Lokiarchaeia archaeon]